MRWCARYGKIKKQGGQTALGNAAKAQPVPKGRGRSWHSVGEAAPFLRPDPASFLKPESGRVFETGIRSHF